MRSRTTHSLLSRISKSLLSRISKMGVHHLFIILGLFVKSYNPGAFCQVWYEKHQSAPRVGNDASALIHPLLRRHKHLLLLGAKDGSNIVACSLR